MARPVKWGLDSFPLDVNFFGNRKIGRLRRKHGVNGVMLYLQILCCLYKKGYYLDYNGDLVFDLSYVMRLSEEETSDMILSMISFGLFDKVIFKNRRVLSSKSIQMRYLVAKKNLSKDKLIDEELDLISDL